MSAPHAGRLTCLRFRGVATFLAALLFCVQAALGAPRKDCYVIDRRGEKHDGMELTVTSTRGDLLLNVDGRVKLPFKAGAYRFAYVPKPNDVATLEKVYEGGRHDAVVSVANSLFDTYKFLGWGDFIAYLEGMSLIETDRPEDAVKAFTKGQRYQGLHGGLLTRGMIRALLDLGDTERAEPMLAKMITSEDDADAAFALASRARMLENQNKNKEAVLEYLKILLFFDDDKDVDVFRDQARERAVALLKDMKDSRWKRIEALR